MLIFDVTATRVKNWYAIARVKKIRSAARAKKRLQKSGGQPGRVSVRVRIGPAPHCNHHQGWIPLPGSVIDTVVHPVVRRREEDIVAFTTHIASLLIINVSSTWDQFYRQP